MKYIFLILFSLVYSQLIAQRPMTYNALKPKVDSILIEEKKISTIFELYKSIKPINDDTLFNSESIVTYFKNDTVNIILPDKNGVARKHYSFSFFNSKLLSVDSLERPLTSFEAEILDKQKELFNHFNQMDNAANYIKLFINDSESNRLYAVKMPSSNYELPIRDNYLITYKANGTIKLKKYNEISNPIKSIDSFGDTVKYLFLKTQHHDKYIYSIDIFVFKNFRPEWWIKTFTSYSSKNRREFIYDLSEDKIKIVKFPNEK